MVAFMTPDSQNQLLQLILGEQSPMLKLLPEFKPRQAQIVLAEAVLACLEGEKSPLVAQVGTGTGKTLAYLVPALLSGLKIIISTGSKTLQDQVSDKEMPLLKHTLAPDLRWAILKGRANYLCLRRLATFQQQARLSAAGQLLEKFCQTTPDGDLDQIRSNLSLEVIEEITTSSEQCQFSRCPQREQCFMLEARRKAAEADIVVVNHHLFMADLALKAGGYGHLLPRWQGVVFDEAHMLPEIATQAFAVQVSQQRVAALLRDVARAEAEHINPDTLGACRQCSDTLFTQLGHMAGLGNALALNESHLKKLAPLLQKLEQSLDTLAHSLDDGERDQSLAEQIKKLQLDLQTLPNPLAGHSVAWARTKGASPAMLLSPVEVGPFLQQSLYAHEQRLIFTSATLAPLHDLTSFMERMGLDSQVCVSLSLPSPFDLTQQARLYVPRNLPDPLNENFIKRIALELEKLLTITRGRAFVLFTSHRNLQAVAEILQNKLPFALLVQGQAPKLTILKQFVQQSPAVLLATASFWQGVDIPGPDLSAVIIDKLPFAPPDDPLLKARCALIEENGGNGFMHILVPEAILSLKQGLGRLIRGPQDYGLLAVLDSRIWRKGYGRQFLKSLEPVPVIDALEEVEKFFQRQSKL
jgi:ATP-dependent DNA helicase DinG